MEKLSRTAKYKNYRDGMNNDSEREIATKELRKLQDKIILNEKRFGNSSRTENDLIRGRRNASYDDFYDNYYGAVNNELNTPNKKEYNEIDDIFGEINKFRSNNNRQYDNYYDDVDKERSNDEFEDKDEYIRKIREIVNNAGSQSREPIQHETYSRENRYNVERTFEREKYTNQEIIERENKYNEYLQQQNQQIQPSVEEENIEESKVEFKLNDDSNDNNIGFAAQSTNDALSEEITDEVVPNYEDEIVEAEEPVEEETSVLDDSEETNDDANAILETSGEILDEEVCVTEDNEESKDEEKSFEDDSLNNNSTDDTIKDVTFNEEEYVSPMDDIVLEKPELKAIIPQRDDSIAFKEICETANTLADEIESTSSFAQSTYVPQSVTSVSNNSLEGLQNDINKDLMNLNKSDDFMSAIELEVNQYNKEEELNEEIEEPKEELVDDQKHVIRKSEVSEEMKEEYEHTVSFEVGKLMDEINSSKSDYISAEDIIKDNDLVKKDFDEDRIGKTIAFDAADNIDIPDNTIVLSRPDITEDASIHTMSFKTEELDEKDEKNNTLLNIILTILVIIAIAALGVMAYFFLITRGII